MANPAPQSGKGILYIPDISGFTNFVTHTELEHSRHIIEELLELIIDEGQARFRVSEIEGDAVLFYAFGHSLSLEAMVALSEKMFSRFHQYLLRYERDRVCHCGACSMAHQLSLKFIAHAGVFSEYKVREFSKLIGENVIFVHRLLKNKIPEQEYILLTDQAAEALPHEQEIMDSFSCTKERIDSFGSISYYHKSLASLLAEIPVLDPEQSPVTDGHRISRDSAVYIPARFCQVLDAITNVEIRKDWFPYLTRITLQDYRINRRHARHTCVFMGRDWDVDLSEYREDSNEARISEYLRLRDFNLQMTMDYFIQKDMDENVLADLQISFTVLPATLTIIRPLMQPVLKWMRRRILNRLIRHFSGAVAA